MKKFLSVLLCAVLLCGMLAIPAAAAPNYCELFQSQIRALRWQVELGNQSDVAPGGSFNTHTIVRFALNKLSMQYYVEGQIDVVIPADVFEAEAAKWFAKVDVAALRAYEDSYWDGTQMVSRQSYSAADKTYTFAGVGGVGDSTTYAVQGYTQSGSQYTVYSYFFDQAGDEIPAGSVKGVDYITYNGIDCLVYHRLKTVVETDGTSVKFHSWQRVDSIPAADTLIVPGEVVPDPTTTTKKTTTTTKAATTTTKRPTGPDTVVTAPNTTTSADVTTTATEATTTTTQAEEPLVTVAEIETAKLEAAAEVFPENTVVTVERIEQTETLQTIETAVKEVATAFVAYEITAKSDNVTVQPNGKVKATFDVPTGYDAAKVIVLYVAPDGTTETVPSTVDAAAGTVTAELSHFSTYVVAESTAEDAPADTDTPSAAEPRPISPVVWIVIAAVVVLLGAAAWYFLIYRKK